AIEYTRNNFKEDIAGAKMTADKEQMGPPSGKPVNLEISGKSMNVLENVSNRIITILENDPDYNKPDGLQSNLSDARPEIKINVNREKEATYGLSTRKIGETVRQAINGVEASEYRDGKDEYDIIVRLDEQYRNNLTALGNLTIMNEGQQIPLSKIGRAHV